MYGRQASPCYALFSRVSGLRQQIVDPRERTSQDMLCPMLTVITETAVGWHDKYLLAASGGPGSIASSTAMSATLS